MALWLIGGGSSVSRSVKFGVVVFKASLLKWGGSVCHRTMLHDYTFPLQINHRSLLHCYTPCICPHICALCYMWKLMLCSGLPYIYGQLEEGGQSVMKLIWCSGLPWICGQLEERHGVSVSWKLCSVMVFQGYMFDWLGGSISLLVCCVSVVNWRRWWGQSVMEN